MIKHKAFTLIELLIVFAVIGLLAGIILASVKSVRDRASIAKTLQYGKSVDNLLAADAVGIWNFDDQTNPTKDTSGWANHGTINGAAFTTDTPHRAAGAGAGKYALSFDGNDYVDCGGGVSLNIVGATNYTIAGWFKAPVGLYPTNNSALAGKWKGNAGYMVYFTSNGVVGVYTNSSYYLTNILAINDGNWHHLVGVREGAGGHIYLDGTEVSGSGTLINISTSASNFDIGTYSNDEGANFNGLIDEVRIFSRALSQAEIQKLYTEGAARHGMALK